MRLRQCHRPRATSPIWVSVWILLSGAAVVPEIEDASAATLGAFEVRLSDLRATDGHDQIEYALADNGVPIVMTDQVADKDAADKDATEKDADGKDVAADGAGKAAEPAGSETARNEAKKPLLDAGDDDTPAIAAGGSKAAKPANAGKIVVPKGGVGYYDGRAAEVLKAEMQRAATGTTVTYEPGTSVVVCVGGCSGGHMGVVFVQAKAEPATTQAGEMQQSAASDADAPPEPRRDEIACIAGCYDDAPRSHPALTPERMQHDLQNAIDSAGSGARRQSAKPDDDWQTARKAKASPRPRQARARASEKPGAWFTRIIKSREPEHGQPVNSEPLKAGSEKAEPGKQ